MFSNTYALVADDNPVALFGITSILTELGIAFDTAVHGLEALELLHRSPEKYDWLLLDIDMPVMTGLEAAKHVRSNSKYSKLPIIAITASEQADIVEQCIAAGFSEVLPKHVTAEELKSTLKFHCLKEPYKPEA